MAAPLSPIGIVPSREEARWRSSAVRALVRLLSRDTLDLWSAEQLERIAPYPSIWAEPAVELKLLRKLRVPSNNLPRAVAAAVAGLEIEAGDPLAAVKLLERPFPGALGEAQRLHLLAAAHFAIGRDSLASATYYAGAAAIRDSADANVFGRELQEIAEGAELREWRSTALVPTARAAWLGKFWAREDLADGRLPGTRLREQFSRWRLALQQYRWDTDGTLALGGIPPRGAAQDGSEGDVLFPRDEGTAPPVYDARYFERNSVIDDRGLLVLRHGAPTNTITSAGVAALAQESLVWSVASANGDGGPELRIVSFSRAAVRKIGVPSFHFGMLARNVPMGDLMSLCQVDARLCALAGPGDARVRANLILQNFTAMRTNAEVTQGNPQRFNHPLRAVVQAFGIPDGGVLVVMAVPLASLAAAHDAGSAATSLKLRVIVGDPLSGEITGTVDTIRHWRLAQPVPVAGFLSFLTIVPAGIGTWQVAVTAADIAGETGGTTWISNVPVIATANDALTLGDPILGRVGGGLEWQWQGQPVLLNPTNAWHTTELATLSVVASGLRAGEDYGLRLELWPSDTTAKSPRLTITSDLRANASTMMLQRSLDLSRIGAGDYRLVLRLSGKNGATTTIRERRVAVRK
ncbi:MAG: hypothetical protein V4558_08885 [Gemmatimonadota bacterium]